MDERMRELRRLLNLTQEEFGKRLGIRRSTVATYESGRNDPVDAVVSLICKEFNVNEEWLRTGNGEMFNPDPDGELEALARKYEMNRGEYIFLEKYFRLKKEERVKFMEFLQDVFDTIRESEPEDQDDDLDIEAEVAAYRRELELQKKARAGSSASDGSKSGGGDEQGA